METNRNAIRLVAAPYVRLAHRILRGAGTFESIAFDKEVLCKEEVTPARPPIYDPDHLQRVTSGTKHGSVESEIRSMLATSYTHSATIAYHLRDVVVRGGSLYAANMRHFVTRSVQASKAQSQYFRSGALVSTATGNMYFGHWLREDCTSYLLTSPAFRPICISAGLTDHQKEYARVFDQDWMTPTKSALIDHLMIYRDFGQNSLKKARYQELADCVAHAFPETKRDKLIFLRRGQTGASRLIENEEKLLDSLVGHGFEILDVQDSFETIIRALRRAKLVVSLEGSQITHSIYTLAPGCGLLVLQPPDRFTSVHRHWSTCRGIEFGFVVGLPGEFGSRFSETEILQAAERLIAAAERTR